MNCLHLYIPNQTSNVLWHTDFSGTHFRSSNFTSYISAVLPISPKFSDVFSKNTSTNSPYDWNQSMRVCYSGVHYHPKALDTTLHYFLERGITVGEPLSRSPAVSRQIRTAHSCSLRHPAQQDIVQMIPQGREAGSSFPPCFFSLHSHLQRLLPPPAHDVTYIRTSEEHIYNTVEWRHREREAEKGIFTPNLPRLQTLFPYMLATVTSVSPFRQPTFISASPNNTIKELAFLICIQEVPASNLDLKTDYPRSFVILFGTTK